MAIAAPFAMLGAMSVIPVPIVSRSKCRRYGQTAYQRSKGDYHRGLATG